MSSRRLIIDVDVGTDDALAILLLLHAEKLGKVKIEAFVCSKGNTSLKNVCRNLVRLLETVGRTDIPVYRGSHQPMLPATEEQQFFHGIDGFGDLEHDKEPDVSVIKKELAATAVNKIVSENPGEITLVCLGPLTNAALALRMFESFAGNLKDLYIMGGNYKGVGNSSASAEYNFHTDPEAAYIVFEMCECPIVLVPWELMFYTNIPFEWRWSHLGDKGGPMWRLIDRAERSVYKDTKDPNWLPCDAYVSAVILHPEIITRSTCRHISVELHGRKTRGQVVVDHLETKKPNTILVERVDCELFKKIVLDACHEM